MEIYAILVTIIAVVALFKSIKWKIATRAIALFCIEKFRKPTDEEIADYSKRAASKMLKK